MEIEFKLKNPSSKVSAEDLTLEPPPRYIEAPPAFFEPGPRLELMDELGLDRSMMWPTLASLIEERLASDPLATHAVVHALNEWMHEAWSFNYEDRIFATPVITLPIIDKAIEELEWVLERGAKAILIRPAPVPDFNGRRRSFALEEFDPFWKRVEEADIVVGMHASDDGSQRYINEWEGLEGDEFKPFGGRSSAFVPIITAGHRGIHDVVASIIGHGLASRFPELKIVPVENGSAWVRPAGSGAQPVVPTNTRHLRRGSGRCPEAVRLRASVSRRGSAGPDRARRSGQRGLRVGLPASRGDVQPDLVCGRAPVADRRRTRPRSWAATSAG